MATFWKMVTSPMDLQLVLLPFCSASEPQVEQLTAAVRAGSLAEVGEVLQRPQDPDLADAQGARALSVACHEGHVGMI